MRWHLARMWRNHMTDEAPEVTSVSDLLDRMEAAADKHEPVSIGNVLDEVGHRSFGPLLLLAGVVMMAPVVGDIPGVPVLMGLTVLVSTAQLLIGHDHFWLPGWIARRSVSDRKLRKGVRWMRPVARFLDRWTKPRLQMFTRGVGATVAAVACAIIAMATPLMEVVPMSANVAGLAITAYGLALIASDGLVAIFAAVFSGSTLVLIVRHLLA